MTLKEKLQKIADASAKQIPEDARSVMHRTTQAVADSLGARKIPGAGDALPAFELPDSNGNLVSSASLVDQGPFVLSFFRGKW
jgi:hypothetical protein